ncbi:MAG: plasmid pRiA4b ORF-3 family protein [Syntrophales bacterium]|nr:plasmid pRiA4b ORF-3 family protein [Syntrophales bacterium]
MVYQFKITLKGIRPPVWRRIQVPEYYTFWDLHVAIQDAMGWLDYHLHLFRIIKPSTGMKEEIGVPDKDFEFETRTLSGRKRKIADYFFMDNPKADYQYDFGDDWEHTITLEKIVAREEEVEYPVCIAGKNSCPPEDCGGTWGYQNFLEIIKNPDDEEYEEMLEWVGGEFDPEGFDIKDVCFDDPDMRWEIAFG